MRTGCAVAVTGALLLGAVGGAEGADAFRSGPYLQNVSKTSVRVMWEVRRECSGEILVRAGGTERAVPFDADAAADDVYEITIDGLSPGHRYSYEVRCDDHRAGGEFATAPEPGVPFSFVVFGDSRSNAGTHRMVIERIRREVPDFLLSTGDLVDDGGQERQWQEFFDIEHELLRENVMFPSVGNHDRQGRGRTADNYRKYFSLPENSPDPERYYAFSYASARFLVLDSNAYSFSLTDQTAWIERELQAARLDPSVEHVFVIMHHPPFSIALHGGQKELRERWTPLFEKYRVSAVFSGHDHVYSRAENEGIRYFVTGGAGAPVYPRARQPSPIDLGAMAYFERVHHYVRVQVIGSFVEVSAIRVDGTLIETVSWGQPPRPELEIPVAQVGPGAGTEVAAVGAGPGPAPDRAMLQASAISAPGDDGGWGLTGLLGALMMLCAGGMLVWSLRS
ncbi:metallophosphoesterase [Haliangium sp.]|uniref:metallophosphoesterase family protein n=1 Tax=Haliangium sp. TaxID=2663208 RepID=UPI003D12DCB1